MTDGYTDLRWRFDDADRIGRITLDRPDSLNALSPGLREELVDGFERFRELDADPGRPRVDAIVLDGAGDRAFSVGADVNAGERTPPGVKRIRPEYTLPAELPMPVVAAIDGYCLGGGLELALACDFRVATPDSELGFPESRLGILPANGGLQRLAAHAGPSRAKELAMSGARVDAGTAAADGFVDHVRDADAFDDFLDDFLGRIGTGAPLAVRAAKDVVNEGLGTDLETAIAYEHRASRALRGTRDYEEGTSAFGTDREPEWQGR